MSPPFHLDLISHNAYIVQRLHDTNNPKNQLSVAISGNDSNLLIVFYVQIMPDDFVIQLHRF
ncbi:hypothetical protein B6J58_00015 [Klebsiella quasipneumoniae]|nr:hypothetical protein B6J57_25435 [Klebsiella pneumoniae]PLJ06620.1 hypothetical protein B6J58_00015 [Klebsiella quasipneumoniae]